MKCVPPSAEKAVPFVEASEEKSRRRVPSGGIEGLAKGSHRSTVPPWLDSMR